MAKPVLTEKDFAKLAKADETGRVPSYQDDGVPTVALEENGLVEARGYAGRPAAPRRGFYITEKGRVVLAARNNA